jgi:hypothetical protein
MRVAMTVGAVMMVAAAPAQASHGHDFAAGSAKNMLVEVSPFPADLRLSAHASDDRISGHAVGSGALPNGEFKVQGHVTCLRVVGNRATIKYRFDKTAGPGAPPPGWGVQVFVEDNGSGAVPDGNATDAPLPPELFDPFADQCELPRGPYNPVDSGNYVVHDAETP